MEIKEYIEKVNQEDDVMKLNKELCILKWYNR